MSPEELKRLLLEKCGANPDEELSPYDREKLEQKLEETLRSVELLADKSLDLYSKHLLILSAMSHFCRMAAKPAPINEPKPDYEEMGYEACKLAEETMPDFFRGMRRFQEELEKKEQKKNQEKGEGEGQDDE